MFSFAETRGNEPLGNGGSYASTVYVFRRKGTPRIMSVSVSASPGNCDGVWMTPMQLSEDASFGGK